MFENNAICKLLNIKYPIFQGGMAWIGTAELASAVSNAGGLGIIGAGHMPPDILRAEIQKCKGWTDKPFGVNIMLMSPFVKEVMQVVIDERVPVITTGAGNPGEYMPALKEIGTKVIPVVASVALAKRLVRAGADAVIAEGTESGGHIGEITTMALLPQVVDAVDVPVIGAGGIGDSRGMAASVIPVVWQQLLHSAHRLYRWVPVLYSAKSALLMKITRSWYSRLKTVPRWLRARAWAIRHASLPINSPASTRRWRLPVHPQRNWKSWAQARCTSLRTRVTWKMVPS